MTGSLEKSRLSWGLSDLRLDSGGSLKLRCLRGDANGR